MQKPELLDRILELKRQRQSNKQIALQLQCHRNTVCKYVKYIRANLVKTSEEIVNKIDDKLEDELERMSHKDLIAYRRALVPERIETKGELTQTQQVLHLHMWKPEQIEQQPAT
jgi:hypothetical protein